MPTPEKDRVDAYLATVERLEKEIAVVDELASLTSIAISLKRIADTLDQMYTYRGVHVDD